MVTDSSFEAQKKELYEERSALRSVVEKMNSRNTFNFLSDEGILPNYAFPEAGITLKAVLTRKKRKEEVTNPYEVNDAISIDPKWKDIIEGLVDQDLIDLARRLRDEGVSAPEAGLYADEDDAPMSEFQWSEKKILVQSEDELDYKTFLETQGWKVYGPNYEDVSIALKEV